MAHGVVVAYQGRCMATEECHDSRRLTSECNVTLS